MIYLCQFGQTLAIGSEDRLSADNAFSESYMSNGHQNHIIYFGPPNNVSVPVWSKSGHWHILNLHDLLISVINCLFPMSFC